MVKAVLLWKQGPNGHSQFSFSTLQQSTECCMSSWQGGGVGECFSSAKQHEVSCATHTFFFFFLLFCMLGYECMPVHHMYAWCSHWGQKGLDPLEVEFQTDVSPCVGAWNQIQVLLAAEPSLQASNSQFLSLAGSVGFLGNLSEWITPTHHLECSSRLCSHNSCCM